MKTNLLLRFLSSLMQVGALVAALICLAVPAHADDSVVLPAVGPRPPGEYPKVDCGYLTVYSRTQQTQWGEGTTYYPHSSYRILDAGGHTVKWVENHNSEIDEAPQKVELPPGTYTIKAWSDSDGLVTVPVVIKLARTTAVHLENGRESDKEALNSARAVKTPSGQIVGWKA